MKLAIIGDLHLGLVYKGENWTPRIIECLTRILHDLKENPVDQVIFLGDIFNTATPTIDALYEAITLFGEFAELCVDIKVLAGNHDVKTKKTQLHHAFELLEATQIDLTGKYNFHVEYIYGEPVIQDGEGMTDFAFFPYMTQRDVDIYNYEYKTEYTDAQDVLDNFYINEMDKHNKNFIVFSHLNAHGGKNGSEIDMPCGKELTLPKNIVDSSYVKKIFNGHLHTKQTIGKVICPGSIENLRFGEGIDRCYYRVEI